MANITRFRPTNDALDDLFRGFFMQPVRFEGQPEMQIKMDVSEDDKAYTVHAEIPGVKKDRPWWERSSGTASRPANWRSNC